MRERDLDDLDAEFGRVRIIRIVNASGQFARRTDAGRTGDVHIYVVAVIRIDDDRVRMRSTAGLYVRDVPRMRDLRTAEDAHPPNAPRPDAILNPPRPPPP